MSTKYSGQGTLISATTGAGVRKAISAIANTSPIAVTCTGHGYNTGDTIEQEGTSSVADGQYQITKTSANSYTLNGTTANGTASTGYSIDYELLPAVTIPANGDLVDMGPLGSAIEGAFDPVPFLYRRTGKLRLYNQYYINNDWFTTPFISNPWFTVSNFTSTIVTILSGTALSFESVSDTSGIPPEFAVNDILEINTSFTISTVTHTGTQNAFLQIGIGITQGGTLLSTVGVPSQIVPAYYAAAGGSDPAGPVTTTVSLSGFLGPLASSTLGGTIPATNLGYCLFGRVDYISSVNQIDILGIGEWSGSIKQYRYN